ncbi:MAG: ABC transporter permease [Gemmatimonadaceae bacterium]|nr:ABC transporter permease [Gemmatimonadaceae bacterium]
MTTNLRHAVRSLRRTPGVVAAVILTLGLGIGLATATAAVARTVAFAGLPLRDADRVLVLWGVDRARSFPHLPLRPGDVHGLTDRMRGVADIAAGDYNGAYPWPFVAPDGGGAPLRLRMTLAGGRYFDVLGTPPALGRALRPDDDVVGAPRVIVLSHAAWQRHFGCDPDIIGRTLRSVIFGAAYTIVGVMPPGLDLPRGVEGWTAFVPTAAVDGSLDKSPWAVDVVARIAPGSNAARVRQVLTDYYATLAAAGARQYAGARATSRPVPELVTGDVRVPFRALGAAALVLLVATCGNVAGLLLVRAGARRRELALRTALGATRGTLVRALLQQHALLALAGGAVGALVAAASVRAFALLAPAELPRVAEVGVDWRTWVALAAVTTLATLAIGVAPALSATRFPPASVLGAAHAGAGGRTGDVRTRRILVGAQVALALVLLSTSTLLGRSLVNLTSLDLGVTAPERLSFVELIPSAGWDAGVAPDTPEARGEHWLSLQEEILSRIAALPGVDGVAPVVHEAYAGAAGWDARLEAEGAAADDSARRPYLNMEITNEAYLRVTGGTLLRGRWLSASDRDHAPAVMVLSEKAASILFPGEDAVGRRVRLWGGRLVMVIGIVRDARFREFLEPRATFYLPVRQFDGGAPFLAIRTRMRPTALDAQVRQVVSSLAPGLAVHPHGTMQDRLAEPLARPRLLAAVLGGYALAVVLLAVAGLYVVVASSVSARRKEFGIRAALGATPNRLLQLVMGEGGRVAAVGLVVGVAMVLGAGQMLASLLYGVTANDPFSLAASVTVLLGVCLVAVAVPAFRASAADPASELRGE